MRAPARLDDTQHGGSDGLDRRTHAPLAWPAMQLALRRVVESNRFQNFVTGVIVAAGIVVGLETYPSLVDSHGWLLHGADRIILWIFVAEIAIKVGAEGRAPWRFFHDPWNVFDFIIVAGALLPFEGNAITVVRLLRLLRVLRLVHVLPKLQILVTALIKSIPPMAYVTLLLLLVFYVYAVAGVFLFGANDPVHFTSLEMSMLSLFRIVTLEGWVDILYINMHGCALYGYDSNPVIACTDSQASPVVAVVYFVSFVLMGTMIILNLFIGVILNSMDEAHADAERERAAREAGGTPETRVAADLQKVELQLKDMQRMLQDIRWNVAKIDKES